MKHNGNENRIEAMKKILTLIAIVASYIAILAIIALYFGLLIAVPAYAIIEIINAIKR